MFHVKRTRVVSGLAAPSSRAGLSRASSGQRATLRVPVMPSEAAIRLRATLARFPPEWVRAALSGRAGGRCIPCLRPIEGLADDPMIRQARRDVFDPLVRLLSEETEMTQARRLGRGLEALLGPSHALGGAHELPGGVPLVTTSGTGLVEL